MDDKATIILDGKEYDLPVIRGSEGEKAVDISSGNLMKIITQVLEGEPARITSHNSKVPKDLEIICQKAMFKELSRRYQTADEFATDLDHFLKGEPISARPASFIYKMGKRLRRRLDIIITLAAVVFCGITSSRSTRGWPSSADHALPACSISATHTPT